MSDPVQARQVTGGSAVNLGGSQIGDAQFGQIAQHIYNYYGADAQVAADRFADGLGVLRRLIETSPQIRSTVAVFYERLSFARQRVRALITLKTIHDHLHGLQYKDLPSLVRELSRFPDDEAAHDSIAMAASEIATVVAQVRVMVASGAIAAEAVTWCPQLLKIAGEIDAALAVANRGVIEHAARRAHTIVGTNLSKLNNELARLADDLRPGDLAAPLQELHERLKQMNVDQADVERLAAGIGGLLDLHAGLTALVKIHNGWQTLDDELRRIESSLRVDTSDLEWSWSSLYEQITAVCAVQESWAVVICARRDSLAEALGVAQAPRVRVEFDRLQLLVGRQFFFIDQRLKEHCDRLNYFRDPLNDLESNLLR